MGGSRLGSLLAETGVGALMLNACQSAYATPPREPVTAPSNVHEETRAIGSLAQEVMDAGAPGVVAMRYSVFVVTAAQFMVDVYERLMRGDGLGEAVSFGRKQLEAQPMRGIGFDPLPLRDWCVPVVFEAAPVRLFSGRKVRCGWRRPAAARRWRDCRRGRTPASSGATRPCWRSTALSTASHRAAARLCGERQDHHGRRIRPLVQRDRRRGGPVLFTSFEQHLPLARVLDSSGKFSGRRWRRAGVNWLALPIRSAERWRCKC